MIVASSFLRVYLHFEGNDEKTLLNKNWAQVVMNQNPQTQKK